VGASLGKYTLFSVGFLLEGYRVWLRLLNSFLRSDVWQSRMEMGSMR
jgi:hypothetical protein